MDNSPHLSEYEVYPSSEIIQCPYPFYQALRDEQPVYEIPGRPNDFIVSRYEDCQAILKDPIRFSSWIEPASVNDADVAQIAARGYDWIPLIHNNDPPSHGFYRSVAAKAFTPGRLKQYEPMIWRLSQDIVESFGDRTQIEFVADYAAKLPMTVIVDILGLPRSHMADYKRWSDDFAEIQSKFQDKSRLMALQQSLVDYQNFLADQITDRQKNPGDDVLSEIVHSNADQGFPLEMTQLVGVVAVLLTAGNETTIYLLANGLLQLLEFPDQLKKVRADYELIPKMIEELLRRETSSQYSMRTATTAVQLHGVTIPRGGRVLVMRASANRDERTFDNADVLDIDRPNARQHLSFGAGIHFCLGAPLSRLESKIAFRHLFETFPAISLTKDRNTFERIDHPIFRGIKQLWIDFELVTRTTMN